MKERKVGRKTVRFVFSKRNLIENFIKKHEYTWASQIARETRTTLATVIKWIKILKLENKIEVEKFDGMNLIRWKREKSEEKP
jgi:predicted transcriptional regulator